MTNNSTNSEDLSAGAASQEDTAFAQALLIGEQEKALFRKRSFRWAWIFSSLFFFSVISFSWAIMFCPKAFLLSQTIHSGEIQVPPKPLKNSKAKAEQKSQIKKPDSKSGVQVEVEKVQRESLFNQFLIMLALLSAVGTTLAIAVMRFSFSNEKIPEKASDILSVSPLANAVAELINQIVGLLKKND